MGNNKDADVLLVGSYPPPFGGQSVHIENLYTYLKSDGFSVNVLNTGANKDIQTDEIVSVKTSTGLLRELLHLNKTRLVHVHVSGVSDYGKLLPVITAAFLKRYTVVLTIHSGNIEVALEKPKPLEAFLMKVILSRVDRVICVNNAIREVLSRWIRSERLAVIPAFALELVEGNISEELNNFIVTHDPLITCVGFCEPVYGFDLAILSVRELVKTYRNVGLIIMGDKRGADRYEAMIEEHRLGRNVVLCGNVHHDVCVSVIKRSSIFLRPTLYDGDSISIREALAMQVPVVASSTEFRPAGVELFENGDLEDMVKKIILCVKNHRVKSGAVERDVSNLKGVRKLYMDVMGSEQ